MNAADLTQWLADGYDELARRPVACRLLRSYTNDVYAVTARGGGRFALKVYGDGWRTEPQVRYELDLVTHLAARGLPVAVPVPGRSGDALRRFASDSGGPRLAVLWTFAPGDKPRPPFAPALYRTFGRAVARLHALSDDFVSPHAAARDALDRERLIERPLALALPLVSDADERRFLASVGARLSAALDALISEGLDWGPVHGDATLDNLHVTEGGGIVLYDFDSGGPGWRALDLQGWSFRDPAYAPVRDAFLEGYADVRPVRPADLRAAPYLTVAADVWGIGIDLERRVLAGGEDAAAEYLRERVAFLRTRVRDLLND